jgi:hypothetical protein
MQAVMMEKDCTNCVQRASRQSVNVKSALDMARFRNISCGTAAAMILEHYQLAVVNSKVLEVAYSMRAMKQLPITILRLN